MAYNSMETATGTLPSQWTHAQLLDWIGTTTLWRVAHLRRLLGSNSMDGSAFLRLTDEHLASNLGIRNGALRRDVLEHVGKLALLEDHANTALMLRLLEEDSKELMRASAKRGREGSRTSDMLVALKLQREELEHCRDSVRDARVASTLEDDSSLAMRLHQEFGAQWALERGDQDYAIRIAVEEEGDVVPLPPKSPNPYLVPLTPTPAPRAHPPAPADNYTGKPSSSSFDLPPPPAKMARGSSGPSSSSSTLAASAGGNLIGQVITNPQLLTRDKLWIFQVGPLHHKSTLQRVVPKAAVDPKGKGVVRLEGGQEVSCVVCYEAFLTHPDIHMQLQLPCGHNFCERCLKSTLQQACEDTSLLPIRCCKMAIDCHDLPHLLMDAGDLHNFSARLAEQLCHNKMFCPNTRCSRFINLDVVKGDRRGASMCPGCNQRICVHCKVAYHTGFTCEQYELLPLDKRKSVEDVAAIMLAQKNGWKKCPRCRFFVELAHGCYHMTCRCSYEFCYLCCAKWKTCTCEKWAEEQLLEEGNRRVRAQMAARNTHYNKLQFLEQMTAAIEVLQEAEECQHKWKHRNYPWDEACNLCLKKLKKDCFSCTRCQYVACAQCRYHRMSAL